MESVYLTNHALELHWHTEKVEPPVVQAFE